MKLEINTTKVFNDLIKASNDYRYLILYGGSGSGKTLAVLTWVYLYGLRHPNKRIRLIGESIPVVKRTLLADFKDVVVKDAWHMGHYNGTDMRYTLPNGTFFDFLSFDQKSKVIGPRFHVSYIDEVNKIKDEDYFTQMDIRTKDKVLASFNPTHKFWLAERFDEPNVWVHHSTIYDNKFASKDVVNAIEQRATKDALFAAIYLRGEWGSLSGSVFKENKHFFRVPDEEYPEDFEKRICGIDFGFSNDPAAVVDARFKEGEVYLREVIYETGLTNKDLFNRIRGYEEANGFNWKETTFIADSSEPKSIEALYRMGLDIRPVKKTRDSINAGISMIKERPLKITSSSINALREFRQYMWDTDKNGVILNKPVDYQNHIIDSFRYLIMHERSRKEIFFI